MPVTATLRLLNKYQLRDLFHFGLISGAGLTLDFGVFFLSLHFLQDAFWANMLGNLTGIIFVFAVSTRTLFKADGRFLWRKFLGYLGYNFAMMLILSAAIKVMVAARIWAVVAKALLLPVSFYCSYLFMRWLMTGKFSWR